MSSTITLQNTVTWAQGYLFGQPASLGGALEPAITIANIIKQAMLGPPFCWRWNRAQSATLTLAQGVQFVSAAIANFGFIEKGFLATSTQVFESKHVVGIVPFEAIQGRPDEQVAAQIDDNAGNIQFNVGPAPDSSAYTLTLLYQKKPTLFTALANTWAPIPDELSYIYQYGFLGMALAFNKDPRSQIYDARFIAHLLGCQGGLSEMEKNIFLGNWLTTGLELGTANRRAQLGVEGRAQ